MPIRSLYVHLPFCRRRCSYCDFHAEVLAPGLVQPLLWALRSELARYRVRYDLAFEAIFVGGGTPTVLPAADLGHLLEELRAWARPGAQLEFSIEANPATVAPAMAHALAAAGVNRVSLGAQSFEPAELRVLERIHTPSQVNETVAACRAQGIPQISLDLIFAIPGQTLASWQTTLAAALALRPEHISCYGLTYEPGTGLHEQLQAGRVERTDPDLEADMYEAAIDTLGAAGLEQYEISNFARPGCRCRHHLACWHNEPYLGLGPSAAGFVDGIRYRNVPDTAAYIDAMQADRSAWVEQEQLDEDRRAGETAMLALRLIEGIDRRRFAERFGDDPAERFATAVSRHAAEGRIMVDANAIRLTRAGLLVADTVLSDFV
ncbi:MAG: radical SAM family heme chaperone HemW [Planctomycetes bacterium]|nr:radical SAM family heme chaperone HemW [Planctomycetota bacterium]